VYKNYPAVVRSIARHGFALMACFSFTALCLLTLLSHGAHSGLTNDNLTALFHAHQIREHGLGQLLRINWARIPSLLPDYAILLLLTLCLIWIAYRVSLGRWRWSLEGEQARGLLLGDSLLLMVCGSALLYPWISRGEYEGQSFTPKDPSRGLRASHLIAANAEQSRSLRASLGEPKQTIRLDDTGHVVLVYPDARTIREKAAVFFASQSQLPFCVPNRTRQALLRWRALLRPVMVGSLQAL
jgi:hypothetical protein